MSSQEQRKQGAASPQARDKEAFRNLDDVAQAAGRGDGNAQQEGHGTPPGGDVRTVYSADRDPGDPEPEQPRG